MVNNWLRSNLPGFTAYQCALCGSNDCSGRELCDACFGDLPWIHNPCPRCATSLPGHHPKSLSCGKCQTSPPPYDRAICLFAYQYPIDLLITSFKFSARLHLGRLFGELMADAMACYYSNGEILPDAIVPVPLHSSRLRERGFNQAHEIARYCSQRMGIPLLNKLCKRTKRTRHQPGLKISARRNNLRNAFELNNSTVEHCPKHILLVDDVMTTGTTLGELAEQFRRAGTREVHVWSIARALTD